MSYFLVGASQKVSGSTFEALGAPQKVSGSAFEALGVSQKVSGSTFEVLGTSQKVFSLAAGVALLVRELAVEDVVHDEHHVRHADFAVKVHVATDAACADKNALVKRLRCRV